jgi:hypothetical protein
VSPHPGKGNGVRSLNATLSGTDDSTAAARAVASGSRLAAITIVIDEEDEAVDWLYTLDEGDLQAIHSAAQAWMKYVALAQADLPAMNEHEDQAGATAYAALADVTAAQGEPGGAVAFSVAAHFRAAITAITAPSYGQARSIAAHLYRAGWRRITIYSHATEIEEAYRLRKEDAL